MCSDRKRTEYSPSSITSIVGGGITTQLMMAAACIEVQGFIWYLQNITHSNSKIDKDAFLSCTDIETYIRSFKKAQNDLSYSDVQHKYVFSDSHEAREEELSIIRDLKDIIYLGDEVRGYEFSDECEKLDSWAGLQTDIDMLCRVLYDCIRLVILEMDSIIQLGKTAGTIAETNSKKKHRHIKTFREFIKDAARADEIIKKLHSLIGNQKDTAALKVIAKAMWIEWIYRPTATSIKKEFSQITCSGTIISRCLNEEPPTLQSMIEKIQKEFEQS